ERAARRSYPNAHPRHNRCDDSEARSRRLQEPLHRPTSPAKDPRRRGIGHSLSRRDNTTTAPIANADSPTAAAIFGSGSGTGGGTNVTPVSSVRAGSLALRPRRGLGKSRARSASPTVTARPLIGSP